MKRQTFCRNEYVIKHVIIGNKDESSQKYNMIERRRWAKWSKDRAGAGVSSGLC